MIKQWPYHCKRSDLKPPLDWTCYARMQRLWSWSDSHLIAIVSWWLWFPGGRGSLVAVVPWWLWFPRGHGSLVAEFPSWFPGGRGFLLAMVFLVAMASRWLWISGGHFKLGWHERPGKCVFLNPQLGGKPLPIVLRERGAWVNVLGYEKRTYISK